MAGFTIVEVLVALVLLSTAAGLLLAAQAASTRLTRQAMETELALWLARSRLIEAAAYPDRAPPEDSKADYFEGVSYITRIEYREISPSPIISLDRLSRDKRLIEIQARVSWGKVHVRSVQLTTLRPMPKSTQ